MTDTPSAASPRSGFDTAAQAVLTGLLNHLLANEDWARTQLLPHAGKTIRLEASPFSIDLAVLADGRIASPAQSAAPDVVLSTPIAQWPQLVAALASGEGDRALLRHARVAGDADLANAVATVAKHLRWDAEDDLARWVGNAAAHRVATSLAQWRAHAGDRAQRVLGGLVDALTQEHRTLVLRAEAETFADAVRVLREDLDRLEKRIARVR